MELNFRTRAFINMTINLSKPGKKRIITNKIFLIIFIIYISSVYIDVELHISQNDDELYIITPMAIMGFIVTMDGLSRYADYEKGKHHRK